MATKKRKAAKKAVKKKTGRPAARRAERRKQPDSLRLRSAAPGFTVSDINRSLHFYSQVLGFTVKERWERNGELLGAEVRSGTVSLMLGQDDFKKGRDRVKGVGCRIYCSTGQSVDKVAALIKACGGVLDHEPQTQPWGARDFGITDPDGYKLTISQDL
jgi:uncharacterized glyoxalase superfamily protein PhnB